MPIEYDFTTEVTRNNAALKEIMTPISLKKKGIVTLAAGEMDYKCAPVVNQAIMKMAQRGYYGFTLKDKKYEEALHYWFKKVRGIEINPEDIVTTLGTIHSLANCIKLFCKKNDAIIVLAPYYSRYKQAADRLGRKTVVSKLKEVNLNYQIDFEDLEIKFKNPHNKLLVLNNPLNPSGQIFSKETLQRLADLANKYQVVVFSDEIFADISLSGQIVPSYYNCQNDHYGIVCTSLGKSFSMTGLNHANVLIKDAKLREAFSKQRTNDHYGSIDPLAYEATLAAYTNEGYKWLKAMIKVVKNNSLLVHKTIEQYFPEVRVFNNEASFVCWLDFSAWDIEGQDLHNLLLKKALLDLDTGDDYGKDHLSYARMNLATTTEQITKAMERLKKGFNR